MSRAATLFASATPALEHSAHLRPLGSARGGRQGSGQGSGHGGQSGACEERRGDETAAALSRAATALSKTCRPSFGQPSGQGQHGPAGREAREAAAGCAIAAQPTALLDEAAAMCRAAVARGASSASGAGACAAGGVGTCAAASSGVGGGRGVVDESLEALEAEMSPRNYVDRPLAPTPEQTRHWLKGFEATSPSPGSAHAHASPGGPPEGASPAAAAAAAAAAVAAAARPAAAYGDRGGDLAWPASLGAAASRADAAELVRPRSPTPTKMFAWAQDRPSAIGAAAADDSDQEGEGRCHHSDGLIARLIGACQMNDFNKAFAQYDQLQRMHVPMFEGVYKLIIECCMRTHQLGHAMRFYECLKGSGQRISSRLAVLLVEACAREQHGDKVHSIWRDWCPPHEAVSEAHCEVLLVSVSALIRTLSPDLALDVLRDAAERARGGSLAACLATSEAELEELLELNEMVADEARANGTLFGGLAELFEQLHVALEGLRHGCLQEASRRCEAVRLCADDLLMEDLDVDLDLAAP